MLPELRPDIKRILVVRLDNIGDLVMLSPALRALAAAWPEASITLLASPAGTQVAPLLPWIDDVMTFRTVWQDASNALPLDPAREFALIEDIRVRTFDAAFIFTSFSQSVYPPAYTCYLAGIPVRVGQAGDFGGSVLSHVVRPLPDDAHQVDRNLHLVESVGVAVEDRRLELSVLPSVQQAARAKLSAAGVEPDAPYIVLAPGASCPARTYDPTRFGVAARRLAAETGWPVVVVGGDRERALAERLFAGVLAPDLVSLLGETDVPELCAVISKASLVLANDSAPMHIGDAFGRPLAVLFSGTDMEGQWRPRNAPARLLRVPTACAPCYLFTCPFHMECLDIPPERVAQEALDLLETPGSPQSPPLRGAVPR